VPKLLALYLISPNKSSLYSKGMNLLIWLITGALIGAGTATYFANSSFYVLGDIIVSILGALLGGYAASFYVNKTPITEWDLQVFSPGAFIWVVFFALVFIITFNKLF
jgi:uncharacterized membrane protein YeaQ/YmgE (transglycosylase-associated protein family)